MNWRRRKLRFFTIILIILNTTHIQGIKEPEINYDYSRHEGIQNDQVSPISVSIDNSLMKINTDSILRISVTNLRSVEAILIVLIETDSSYLVINNTKLSQYIFSNTTNPDDTYQLTLTIYGQLPTDFVLAGHKFNITGFYDSIDPLNRISETIDMSFNTYSDVTYDLISQNQMTLPGDDGVVNYGYYSYTTNGAENKLTLGIFNPHETDYRFKISSYENNTKYDLTYLLEENGINPVLNPNTGWFDLQFTISPFSFSDFHYYTGIQRIQVEIILESLYQDTINEDKNPSDLYEEVADFRIAIKQGKLNEKTFFSNFDEIEYQQISDEVHEFQVQLSDSQQITLNNNTKATFTGVDNNGKTFTAELVELIPDGNSGWFAKCRYVGELAILGGKYGGPAGMIILVGVGVASIVFKEQLIDVVSDLEDFISEGLEDANFSTLIFVIVLLILPIKKKVHRK